VAQRPHFLEVPVLVHASTASWVDHQLGAWRVPLMLAALALDTASNATMNDLITRLGLDDEDTSLSARA